MQRNALIRPEMPSDIDAVRTVNINAFANHLYSQQTEHLIVQALRKAKALTLSFVAELDGQVVGHIAFSPALINGIDQSWYTLGPVAVLPAYQKQGIGIQLVKTGLDALKQLGAKGCLLVGDPNYYPRFGFRHSDSLTMPGIPSEYFMCLPFDDQIPMGKVSIHPGFYVTENDPRPASFV